MGESLWADFDEKAVAVFLEHMGPESDYDELRLNKVVATVLLDQREWDNWAANGELPALIVEGDRKTLSANSHGAAFLDKEYLYRIAVIAEGDEAECVRSVKILLDRVETVLMQQQPALAIGASNGERVQRLRIENALVDRIPKTSSDNLWYGIGAQGLFVKTSRTLA